MPTEGQPAIANETVFARYFEQYRPQLLAVIASQLGSRAQGRRDADDLVQKVYLKARDRLDAYAQSNLTLIVWLYGQAKDVIRDDHDFQNAHRRNVRKEQPLPEETSAGPVPHPAEPRSTPSQHVAKEELQKLMHERLAVVFPRLSAEDRELIKLKMDGLDLAEIAQKLGITHAAARKRHGRARLKLHELWVQLYGEPESLP